MIGLPPRRAVCQYTRPVLVVLPLLLAGCGVAEYEAHMLQTQERYTYVENVRKYLDDFPITIPTHKEKEVTVPVAQVFFRPPRGIAPTVDPTPRAQMFYRYTLRQNVSSAAGSISYIEVAFGTQMEPGKRGEFAKEVMQHFSATSQPVAERISLASPMRKTPLMVDASVFDSSEYTVAVCVLSGPAPVAVAFWMPQGRYPTAREVIRLSLSTLATGSDAGAVRLAFANPDPWGLTVQPTAPSPMPAMPPMPPGQNPAPAPIAPTPPGTSSLPK